MIAENSPVNIGQAHNQDKMQLAITTFRIRLGEKTC